MLLILGLLFSQTIIRAEEDLNENALNQKDLNREYTVIYLEDFGADPSGKEDSGRALQQALVKIKELSAKGEHTILKFAKNATYTIKKEFATVKKVHTSNTDSVRFPNKHIGILIEGIKNLIIDGQGSELIIEGDMMALGIFQSENIKLKNLAWDYRTPTTSELTIFAFDKNNKTIDFFVPKYMGYTLRGNTIIWHSEKDSKQTYYWTRQNDHNNYGISVKYPNEKMGRAYHSHQGPFQNVRSIEKLANGLLRVSYRNNFNITPVLGMNYQLVSNQERPSAGALVWESKDVELKNVKISYMHGFGFLVQMSENVIFDQIKMANDPRTGKFTSSYADGIHISGAKGKIIVKNSFFNNTHDDPINIHGTFTRVESKINNRKLRLAYIHKQQGGFNQFKKGDKVVFYSRDTLESQDNEKEFEVVSSEMKDDKVMEVEFTEDLPGYLTERIGWEPKFVAENVSYTPK